MVGIEIVIILIDRYDHYVKSLCSLGHPHLVLILLNTGNHEIKKY